MNLSENMKVKNLPGFTTLSLPGEGLLIYYFADGSTATDEKLKWDDCPIHKLVKLELYLHGRKYALEAAHCPNFVEFIQFKTAVSGRRQTVCISRTIGYTDGNREYLIEVNARKAAWRATVLSKRVHVHPRSKKLKDYKKGLFEG